jgi:acetyl-CoA decarbonylase/synthase complex subunit beta
MRSPKFMQADGGWDRVVWMPGEIKEQVRAFIPSEIVDKIASEQDVSNIEDLREWLIEKGHPIVERWDNVSEELPEEPGEITVPTLELPTGAIPIQGIPAGMGFRIILKNAKIKAEKLIIKIDRGS